VEGTFRRVSLVPPATLFSASTLAAAGGIGLLAATPRAAAFSALSAGLGLGVGFNIAKNALESPPALVVILLAPATLVAFLVLAFAWRWPRTRVAVLLLALALAAAIASSLFLGPYFQHPPTE
jgi:hypothetical protein